MGAAETRPLLFLLGANHRSAPMELREQLYIDPEELQTLLPIIKERFGFLELAAISTCNRFELFGLGAPTAVNHDALYDAYLALQRATAGSKPFRDEDVKASLYIHLDEAAIMHVYRVASSLDSLVLGETQITGQFKDALTLAQTSRTTGPTLTRLGQEALATAKKVRTQTAIGKKHVSISHAAIELAQKVFGDLSQHKILIIGAGEMSQVAAKYIQSYAPEALFIANRTLDRAMALVKELGFGEAFPISELGRLLTMADVVLSCTAASGFVIEADDVRRAMGIRRGRPQILIDIALPRDIDPAVSKLDDVYLFDIDDLKQVVDSNVEERQRAATEAETIIERGVAQFSEWQRSLSITPMLKGFRSYLDQLISREAQKTLSRETFKELTPKQREGLSALFEAIAGKISGDASRSVRQPPSGYFPDQLADALAKIFRDETGETQGTAEDAS